MTKNRSNYVNKIEVLNDALKVSFANNSEDIFPNLWLRDHAKDESIGMREAIREKRLLQD